MQLFVILLISYPLAICHAAEHEITEIIVLMKKHHRRELADGNWREHGKRFEELMKSTGEKVSKRSIKEIEKLDPHVFSDRIELIALHLASEPKLFAEIYKTYVRHPSEEELEKRRQEFLLSDKESGIVRSNKYKTKGKGIIRPVALGMFSPYPVAPEHLKTKYRYCLEYFWVAPHYERSLRRYRGTLDAALDDIKQSSTPNEMDIRSFLSE